MTQLIWTRRAIEDIQYLETNQNRKSTAVP
jgi:hypothetical protein